MKTPIFTKKDILDYLAEHGKEYSYNLLLLAGPDSFESYEEYEELENLLTE